MPLHRTVTRSLATVATLTGLAAAFVAGTSYGDGSARSQLEPGPTSDPTSSPTPGSDTTPAAYIDSGLSVPGSCDALLQWYVERGMDLVGPYGWNTYGGPYYNTAIEDAVPNAASGAAGDAARSPSAPAPAPVRATNEETGTNVQEAGVDEPDVVKTDGRTLFRIQDGDLVTYDLSGATVERLASLDLPGVARDTEILLAGDTVVALSHHQAGMAGTGGPVTDVATINVSDPASPVVTHTVEYDADLTTARLHDGVVRLVLDTGLPELDFTLPNKTTTEYEATQANREVVRTSTIDSWLPAVSLDGADPTPLLGCDQVAVPDDDGALGTMAVVGFDASAPDSPSVTGLAVDTDLAYASVDQLYLATTPMSPLRGCFECMDPMPMPQSMPQSMPHGLLPGWLTGHGVTGGPTPTYRVPDEASRLYAFDLDGIDTTFAASGQVDGMIRDRWSMDAVGSGQDAVLRVAVGANGSTGDFTSIVTFRQDGNDLVESGRLDGLGVGEDIESVRWFDTLAIVVTFRQVDPLYAVDLTDPDQPRLMGTLEIPGYSAYLHPLGQHRLLGLGQAQDAIGRWGAQAGLFDVNDLTHPRRLDVVSFGPDSQALATQDPRQLTWLPDGRTVLSVVQDYEQRGTVGYVSVLTLGGGHLDNRMVQVEYGDEISAVRLVPLADGRVVLVTGDGASFFDL